VVAQLVREEGADADPVELGLRGLTVLDDDDLAAALEPLEGSDERER
jgi:hypothetical protein